VAAPLGLTERQVVRLCRALRQHRTAALETVRRDLGLARDAALRRAVAQRWSAKLAQADMGLAGC